MRRAWVAVMVAIACLALANVFGQQPSSTAASGPAGALTVVAPDRLRGGLLFTTRFTIEATRHIEEPTLTLDTGWFEQMTLNAIGPDPATQTATPDGRVVLRFDPLAAGQRLNVWISWQANPTAFGHRSEDVELSDGATPIATVPHSVFILP